VDHFFGDTKANALAVAVQPDEGILVAGIADWNDGRHQPDFALARFNPDGSPDSRFGSNGVLRTDFFGYQDCARAMALQPDGRIVLAGDAIRSSQDLALARYMPDGSLDAGFGEAGKVTTDLRGGNDTAEAVAILPDGSILVGGTSWSKSSDFDFAVVRYRSDGRIDRGFGSNGSAFVDFGGTLEEVRAMAVQPDGRILIAGDTLDTSRKMTHFALARLNRDGSLDGGFGQGGRLVTDFKAADFGGSALVLLPEGKFVIAGNAGSLHSSDFGLARYSHDGKLDPTFGEHGEVLTDLQQFAFHGTRTLARQADGRLLVAVRTETANHAQSFTLARYLP
jgi:uncharacterized delta-60 repeat protein